MRIFILFQCVLFFFMFGPVLGQDAAEEDSGQGTNPDVQKAQDLAEIAKAYRDLADAYTSIPVTPLDGTTKTTSEANMSGIMLAYGQLNYGADKIAKAVCGKKKSRPIVLVAGEDESVAFVRSYVTTLDILDNGVGKQLEIWAERILPVAAIEFDEDETDGAAPLAQSALTQQLISPNRPELFNAALGAVGSAGDLLQGIVGIASLFRVDREYIGITVTGDETALCNAVAGKLISSSRDIYWPSYFSPKESTLLVRITQLSGSMLKVNTRITQIEKIKDEIKRINDLPKQDPKDKTQLENLKIELSKFEKAIDFPKRNEIEDMRSQAEVFAKKPIFEQTDLTHFKSLIEDLNKYEPGRYRRYIDTLKELKSKLDNQEEKKVTPTPEQKKDLNTMVQMLKKDEKNAGAKSYEDFLLYGGQAANAFKEFIQQFNAAGGPFELKKILLAEALIKAAEPDDNKSEQNTSPCILTLSIASAGGEQMTWRSSARSRRESLGGMVLTYNFIDADNGKILAAAVLPLTSGFVEDDEIGQHLGYKGTVEKTDHNNSCKIQGWRSK
ncbi:MAG: hypothetical protein AAGK14_01285 [Verrucomicrobiota bacterium]